MSEILICIVSWRMFSTARNVQHFRGKFSVLHTEGVVLQSNKNNAVQVLLHNCNFSAVL